MKKITQKENLLFVLEQLVSMLKDTDIEVSNLVFVKRFTNYDLPNQEIELSFLLVNKEEEIMNPYLRLCN